MGTVAGVISCVGIMLVYMLLLRKGSKSNEDPQGSSESLTPMVNGRKQRTKHVGSKQTIKGAGLKETLLSDNDNDKKLEDDNDDDDANTGEKGPYLTSMFQMAGLSLSQDTADTKRRSSRHIP